MHCLQAIFKYGKCMKYLDPMKIIFIYLLNVANLHDNQMTHEFPSSHQETYVHRYVS